MGSVQPFLEGSFRNDRARGFGSIQSEAVTRVGRIRSFEEVRNSVDDRLSSNNFPVGRNRVLSRERTSSGYKSGTTALPTRQVLLVLTSVSGSFRIRDELRNGGAFAKLLRVSYRNAIRSRRQLKRGKRGSSLRFKSEIGTRMI